jgi:acetyltransferase
MSIRHLDSLFDPASVAVFGASDRPASVGATVWRNLRGGGFAGPLWPVNPKRDRLDGVPVFARVADLPEAPELAVICTPEPTVAGLIAELGARGTRAAIVLSAGFDEAGRQALRDAARPHLLRLLGPNCLGLLAPHIGLNASFAHVGAAPGSLAFVSQSGALVTALLDWAGGRGIGFSHFVSLGEHADVDFGDMLDWLAHDARTRAPSCCTSSRSTSRASSCRRRAPRRATSRSSSSRPAARRGPAGGGLAHRRAGRLRRGLRRRHPARRHAARGHAARSLHRRRDAGAAGRGTGRRDDGRQPAADAGDQRRRRRRAGGRRRGRRRAALAPLSDGVRAALDAALPAHWSHANPVDIIGDAPVERYRAALQALLDDPASGLILFMHAPTAIVPSPAIAEALVPLLQPAAARVLGCWLGDRAVAEARERFRAAGIACYDTPEQAVRAAAMLATYRRNQAQLMRRRRRRCTTWRPTWRRSAPSSRRCWPKAASC